MKRRWWLFLVPLAVFVVFGLVLYYDSMRTKQAVGAVRLVDGVEMFFRGDTTAKAVSSYPQTREIHVDGDAFIRVPAGEGQWTFKTRLLVLTVDGDTDLRITAYWKETGEQMEVLRGHVIARKSYPSGQAEPEDLRDGDMVLINKTIDLMEKEHTDRAKLEQWSQELMAKAALSKPPGD